LLSGPVFPVFIALFTLPAAFSDNGSVMPWALSFSAISSLPVMFTFTSPVSAIDDWYLRPGMYLILRVTLFCASALKTISNSIKKINCFILKIFICEYAQTLPSGRGGESVPPLCFYWMHISGLCYKVTAC
jgi:hypothetical protein